VDVAPHGITVRWEYTVPAGRKAFVESLQVRIMRTAAATTLGKAHAIIVLIPSGQAGAYQFVCSLLNNTVGASESLSVGQALVLNPGDTLRAATLDGSTGGTCDYFLSCKITEFDI